MNKILSIDVFGFLIFESDAVEFLGWCKDKKREWILSNTNQKDESLIDEFINNPKISKECKCLDCGKNKERNESSGISKEVATVIESGQATSNDVGTDTERPTSTKRRKDKRV